MHKRLISAVLTACMMVSVAACNNNGNGKETGGGAASVPDQSTAESSDDSYNPGDETDKPVKTVNMYKNDELNLTTEYDIQGHEIKIVYYYERTGDLLVGDLPSGSWESFDYDDSGYQIKFTLHNPDDSVLYWEEYKNDPSGNRIEKTTFFNGEKGSVTEYAYDAAGNTILEKKTGKSGKNLSWVENEYDDHGNRTKQIIRDPDGKAILTSEFQNEYDNSGNLSAYDLYVSSEEVPKRTLNQRQVMEYNQQGLCTKKVGYASGKDMAYREDWEYNDKGEVIKNVKYNFYEFNNGKLEKMWEYEYDDRGNKTKTIRTDYADDGTVSGTSTFNYRYEYTYFN